jgi:hypothetical protein
VNYRARKLDNEGADDDDMVVMLPEEIYVRLT